MKTRIRLILILVLVVDVAVAAAFLSGSLDPIMAEAIGTEPSEAGDGDVAENVPSLEDGALLRLGEALARRGEELDRMEEELDELLRAPEVLRRAGLDVPAAEDDDEPVPPPEEPAPSEDFLRLQRAYENMEPESAARALMELAARDRDAVVELLLGWKPRTSGAILDAVTQLDPGLAADLSYEIWTRRGKNSPPPATGGR